MIIAQQKKLAFLKKILETNEKDVEELVKKHHKKTK